MTLENPVIADEFRDELYFAGIPRPLRRAIVSALSPVGRLAGYRERSDAVSLLLEDR